MELIDTEGTSQTTYRFDNLRIKGYKKVELTKAQIKEFRFLFPSIRRGSNAIVKKKLERFITEKNVTFEEILDVTREYVDTTMLKSGEKYIKSADNIAYKRVTGGEESLLANLMDQRTEEAPVAPLKGIDLDDYEAY